MSRKQGKIVKVEEHSCNGRKFEIPMRLVLADSRRVDSNHAPYYLVDIDEPQVRVQNVDYKACLKEARAELEKASAVVWQNVLLISVQNSDERRYYGHQPLHTIQLRLEVEEYQRTPDGGMHRRRPSAKEPSPSVHPGEPGAKDPPPSWDRGRKREPDDTWVPDTEANRTRLAVIVEGMQLLGAKLADLLGQDKITKTLANTGMLQLPRSAS